MRRALGTTVLALMLGALAAPMSARADSARALGRPYAGVEARPQPAQPAQPPQPAQPAQPEFAEPELGLERGEIESTPDGVQDLRAQEDPAIGPRIYGDGGAESLTWDDPELDLQPRGLVHVVLGLGGHWVGATSQFDEAGGGALSVGLDFCLVPSLSLHLRATALVLARTETRRDALDGALRSAVLSVRGSLLVGIHPLQIFALRAGFEVGEGYAFIFGTGNAGTLGVAFVGQAGVRIASGRLEIGFEAAADLREGSVISSAPRSIQDLAPRLAGYLALTL